MSEKEEQKEPMRRYSVTYHKTRIRIPYPRNPRVGVCVGCHRSKQKGEIKVTQMHHTYYKYTTEQVIANPLLALENTLELCFNPCHLVADGFRGILDTTKSMDSIMKVARLLPRHQLIKFANLCHVYLNWWAKVGRELKG